MFFNGLPNDEGDRCISYSIIKMAQGLKLSVVAEGVETLDQLKWLQDQNCEYIQGYYSSRPLPLKDVTQLIHRDVTK
ncbi:EAL domain-containing protein [Neptuniibacter sp. QD48_55]|uniref:EAL domain-containing protein n=1 Tax=Neptuniibacter sp. QD48_55 TaxID=3398212 RepID=UPI0039F641C0